MFAVYPRYTTAWEQRNWLSDLWCLPVVPEPLPPRLSLCHAVLLMVFRDIQSIPSNVEALALHDQMLREARNDPQFKKFLRAKQKQRPNTHAAQIGDLADLVQRPETPIDGFPISDPAEWLRNLELRPKPWPSNAERLHVVLTRFCASAAAWIEQTEAALARLVEAAATGSLTLFGLTDGLLKPEAISKTEFDYQPDGSRPWREHFYWQQNELAGCVRQIRDWPRRSWKHVTVDCAQLLALKNRIARTTSATPGGAKTRGAAEADWTDWLTTEMMRARDRPRPKSEMKEAARSGLRSISGRAFDRAWAKAVSASGATAWQMSGRRRPKNESPHSESAHRN